MVEHFSFISVDTVSVSFLAVDLSMNYGKTPVSVLNELMAARKLPQPTYHEEEACGQFKCTVSAGGVTAIGFSATKKGAKHESAKNALAKLGCSPKSPPVVFVQQPQKNYVGDLNEYSSKKGLHYPTYDLIPNTSIDEYIYNCIFMGNQVLGRGGSKKEAKQDAAKNMMKLLQRSDSSMKYEVIYSKTTVEMKDVGEAVDLYNALPNNSITQQIANSNNTQLTPDLQFVDVNSVEYLTLKLREWGIEYSVKQIQTNPYILSLTVTGSNYNFIESGDTREQALHKALEKVLLLKKNGHLVKETLITL